MRAEHELAFSWDILRACRSRTVQFIGGRPGCGASHHGSIATGAIRPLIIAKLNDYLIENQIPKQIYR
jgi:hypothetical protein